MNKKLYNLTNPQKSILLTEQFYQNTNINNICGTSIIDEEIDFNILQDAVRYFVKNNDSFRLKFQMKNQVLQQSLADYESFNVDIIDINSEDELCSLEEKFLARVFNIETDFLFEFILFRLPNNHGGIISNVHHLISDSWTLGMASKQIIEIYSALKNCTYKEPEIHYTYLKHIEDEQNYLTTSKYEKDKAYWNDIFSLVPTQTSIPSKNTAHDSEFSCTGKRATFSISKKQFEEINKFCTENKISIFNFYTAIFSIYIYRITSINDFVIGTPILNRSNFYDKNTTGMFVNIAPLRILIDENLNFSDFLLNISSRSMELLRHQKYPYQSILEDIRKKDSTVPNLYKILLSYQVTKSVEKSDVNYTTRWNFNGNVADDLDIQIYDINDSGKLDISYDYKTSVYSFEEIEAIHNRIVFLTEQILNKKDLKISEFSIVTEKEKNELLNNSNKTDLKYNENISIIEHFENTVSKYPNRCAITFKNKTFTYKELNEKVNSLAFILRKKGIKNNSIVAIMVNRSMEMIIGILAILKVGGAYLPVDPDYPLERIEYMLENSKAKLLLTQNLLKNKVNFKNIFEIDLENSFYLENKENLPLVNKPEDLSYIIYTSGSTGKPKGVMLTQKNYSNFLASMKNLVPYLHSEKSFNIVSVTTVSFDIFGFETFISLCCGLHLFVTDYFEQKFTKSLEDLVLKNNIEIIQTTPSVMRFHLENLENINSFKNLKYVVLAGEPLTKDLVNKIKEFIPNVRILNGYGPSETTIFASITDVTDAETITIGNPVNNSKFYILDSNLNLVPKNTIGEIYISGDCVGNGYLGNKELTQKSFINCPFTNKIMYKSGDLGLILDDGKVLCKGRIDHQIKLRGLRIELGEIEQRINNYIKNANIQSVIIKKTNNGKEFLHAFICSDTKFEIVDLENYLLKVLPNYMIPTSYSFIDSFPTTPNGKIDKKALNNIEISFKDDKKISPKTKIEKEIFDMISEIVKNSNFGINTNFFSLGLDSLSIISLSTKISNKFGISFSINELYQLTTIEKLAKCIEKPSSKCELNKAENKELYPISTAQKRIYYACKSFEKPNVLYNITGGILVNGALNTNKIQTTINKLIKIHKSLKTKFKSTKNGIFQEILKETSIKIPVEYVDTLDEQAELNKFAKPFSLEEAPLMRAKIYIINNEKTFILLDSHHIVMDGTSLSIFIKDFVNLYNKNEIKEPIYDYIDFSEWENKFLTTKKFGNIKNNWENFAKNYDFPTLELPYDFTSMHFSFVGDTIAKAIPQDSFAKIESIAKRLETSPYVVFLSIFYILLYKYTSQDELVIGTPILGRPDSSLNNTIGMFVNTSALPQKVNDKLTVNDLIKSVKKNVDFAFQNQPFPFESFQELLDKNSDNLINTMFAYQNTFETSLKIANKEASILTANNKISKFDLSLEVNPFSKNVSIEFNKKAFNLDTIKLLLNRYIYLIQNISNLNITLGEITLLSNVEENNIKNKFNNNTIKLEHSNLIQMFYSDFENKCNCNSVQSISNTITYKELDEYSNSLAKILIQNNVKPHDVVGVYLKRSIEQIISIWAILKIGATYMPMYTGYPTDRLNYMIKNSNCKLIITNTLFKENTEFNANSVILDNFENLELQNNTNILYSSIDPTDVAYIIYTSGSTGKPKGVQITHKNLINFVTSFTAEYKEIYKKDTFLASTNISFDVSIWELFMPILNGAKLVLYNEEIINNLANFTQFINNFNITALYIPPNILNEVYELLKQYKNLKLNKMLVGVEAISKKTLNKYFDINPNLIILNGYGPTETTICATCFNYKKSTSNIDENVTIGKPVKNNNIYILDKNLNLQPVGITGEIYITGNGIGNGYINNIQETSKTFLKNILDNNSIYMYKTGDLAKWNSNGTINFIGRKDSQIKISGYRIELKEITNVIEQYEGIKKAITIPLKTSSRTVLSSYFISDVDIDIKNLKEFLKKNLPFYMIPKFITKMTDFPITPNGKINYKSFPTPTISQASYAKPENKIQKDLCIIFEKILGQDKIGIDDDFFELGGDSLLAIKLEIEALKLNIHITYSDIFKYRTIRNLTKSNKVSTENLVDTTFNYKEFDNHLKINDVSNISKVKENNIGNILLIGATGFLGAHILAEFLDTQSSTAYCLIRSKGNQNSTERLRLTLEFYFGKKYSEIFDKRVIVINGDITLPNLGITENTTIELSRSINCVINSAAIVKHYGNYNDFNSINIIGTKNIIEFCKKTNQKLYHISTLSISGEYSDMPLDNKPIFDEKSFYINQSISNFYIYTKFEAEKLILREISNGLDATIFRVGNITNRYSDGNFQKNSTENAFANRIKTFLNIGIISNDFLPHLLEFTPVDLCSTAILKIVASKPNYSVFHIYNTEYISVKSLLKAFKLNGFNIKTVDSETFSELIENVTNMTTDENNNNIFIDLSKNNKLNLYSPVILNADFSKAYLKKLGFKWQKIDNEYLNKYINYFKNIGFFKEKED